MAHLSDCSAFSAPRNFAARGGRPAPELQRTRARRDTILYGTERRLRMPPPSTASPGGPLLVCHSHLRWDRVYQRPQHVLSRLARRWPVLVREEPLIEDDRPP